MRKIITQLRDWASVKLRERCDRLPESARRKMVLVMLGIFALFSLFFGGYGLCRIGEGQEMTVEHLRMLPHEITRTHKETRL